MTHEELESIVKRAAREATLETLALLGFDTDDKAALRADMAHLRRWRKSVDQMEHFGFRAIMTAIVAGVLGALWLGVKDMLGR
jgi:hypothetical protein